MKNARFVLIGASLLGASGVVAGAFGAHALQSTLSAEQLESWSTAVHYQLFHALALLAVGAWLAANPDGLKPTLLRTSAVLLVLGTVLFSGSIYALLLGGPRWFGPVTPLGGTLLIASWLTLPFALSRR